MRQRLIPDYRKVPCPYCDGRGFILLPQGNVDEKQPQDVVIECKFCGGIGKSR